MKKFGMMLIAAAVLAVGFAGEASALPEFKKAFQEKHTDKEKDAGYHIMVKKANCSVCHVKGEEKNVRNAYGDELAKLIEGDAAKRKKGAPDDKKDEVKAKILEELEAAWDKAGEKENEAGEKYNDRIKAGKLPVDLPVKEESEEDPAP